MQAGLHVESGRRIPGLLTLREYAKLGGVWMDVLVDDALDLPKKLPVRPASGGIESKQAKKR
jgi:hypothetical protein